MDIDDELKSNISSSDTWLRLVLIVLFGFVTGVVAMPVVWVMAGVQFLFTLITGKPNENLGQILQSFAAWLNQVFSYMLYVSDQKPFPLSELPPAKTASGYTPNQPTSAGPATKRKETEDEVG